MNELAEQRMMTTKELAEILNVDVRTVNNTVERLGGLLGTTFQKSYGGRPTKLFSEKQSVLIKQEIQKHHNLGSRQIDGVSSEIEENQTILNAISILKNRNDRLIAELETARPKAAVYDRICNADGLKSVEQVSANLGIGKNTFFALMRGMGIFFYSAKDADGRKTNLPKREYVERGYFVTREEPYIRGDRELLYTKIYVTGKGEIWLADALGKREVAI